MHFELHPFGTITSMICCQGKWIITTKVLQTTGRTPTPRHYFDHSICHSTAVKIVNSLRKRRIFTTRCQILTHATHLWRHAVVRKFKVTLLHIGDTNREHINERPLLCQNGVMKSATTENEKLSKGYTFPILCHLSSLNRPHEVVMLSEGAMRNCPLGSPKAESSHHKLTLRRSF